MPSVTLVPYADAGVIVDVTDYELPSNQISDCQNIRFKNKKLIRHPGHSLYRNLDLSAYGTYASATHGSAPVYTFTCDTSGFIGNDINILFDGVSDVNTIIANYNAAAATAKQVTLSGGDGTHILPLASIVLAGGGDSEIINVIPIENSQPKANLFVLRDSGDVLTFLQDNGAGAVTDVSPVVDIVSDEKTNYTRAFGAIIFNAQVGAPHILDVGSAQFRPLENWDDNDVGNDPTCRIITYFKNFYIALSTFEGQEYGNRIRWSHVAEPPTGAGTDPRWIDNDPAYLGGWLSLPDDVDQITAVAPLGDRLMIYTATNIYALVFTGDSYVFTIKKVIHNRGACSQDSVISVRNKHLVADTEDIYFHDGSAIQSILKDKVQDRYLSSVENFDSIKMYRHHNDRDVFIYYTEPGDLGANKAFVINYLTGQWSFIDLPRDTLDINKIYITENIITYDETIESWNTTGGLTWDDVAKVDYDNLFCYTTSDGVVYLGDVGQTADGVHYNSFFQRTRLDLTEFLDNSSYPIKYVNQVLPFIRGTGMARIQLGMSMESHTPIIWTQDFFADLTWPIWKVDTQLSGRYLSYRIDLATPGEFLVNGFEFNTVVRGRR